MANKIKEVRLACKHNIRASSQHCYRITVRFEINRKCYINNRYLLYFSIYKLIAPLASPNCWIDDNPIVISSTDKTTNRLNTLERAFLDIKINHNIACHENIDDNKITDPAGGECNNIVNSMVTTFYFHAIRQYQTKIKFSTIF